MKIIAAIGADGRRPNEVPSELGVLRVGPAGLLDELSFRVGLSPTRSGEVARVVRYLAALQAVDDGSRFFSRSLAADPLASARALLQWRDYAIDHGWQPVSASPGPIGGGRLVDLAAAEAQAALPSECVGERVAAIIAALGRLGDAPAALELLDGAGDWPAPFQRLFAALPAAGVVVTQSVPAAVAAAAADTDLGRLQRALLADSPVAAALPLRGDGSLRLFHCRDRELGARAVSAHLATLDSPLLITGEAGFLLGNAACRQGLADAGLGERSQWRPPQQLLPLLLDCCWSPPPAETLLQYLSLNAGPLRGLRRRIARCFSEQPGYAPGLWDALIEEFVQRRLGDDAGLDASALRQRIADWLPVAAAGNREQMPRELALRLSEQVRDYWRSRYGVDPSASAASHFLAAAGSADALADALRAWTGGTLAREQLARLLEVTADGGAVAYQGTRKVSALNAVTTPEAVRMAVRPPVQLVWWQPGLAAATAAPPFDAAELAALPDAPDAARLAALMRAQLRRALRPILAATGGVTLVRVDDSPDLLRLQLGGCLDDADWQSLDSAVIDAAPLLSVPLTPVPLLPLPQPQRWWRIDRAVACPRPAESYSSLHSLALTPCEYALGYAARLSRGALRDLPVDARLKGELAHRLIDLWFHECAWTGAAVAPATVVQWLNQRLEAVIEAVALPMTAAGMRSERLAFRDTFEHALLALLGQLRDAGVVSVFTERSLRRGSAPRELVGTIDLLGQLEDGRWLVIDMKWGGEKYRAAELREGLYLQLVTYAQLLDSLVPDGSTVRIAELAFFILRSGTLLANSRQVFPNARLIEPADPAIGPNEIWRMFVRSAEWRMQQLQAGYIELTYGAAAPTADSQPPAGCLPLLALEQANAKQASGGGGRKPTFKTIDPWRVLRGAIQE